MSIQGLEPLEELKGLYGAYQGFCRNLIKVSYGFLYGFAGVRFGFWIISHAEALYLEPSNRFYTVCSTRRYSKILPKVVPEALETLIRSSVIRSSGFWLSALRVSGFEGSRFGGPADPKESRRLYQSKG